MPHFTRRRFAAMAALSPIVAAQAVQAASHAAVHEVSIADFAFAPAMIEVGVGDVVRFTNSDGAPHTATSQDDLFDTGRLNSGQSVEVTITTAGDHSYACSFHPAMTGLIRAR